MQPYEDSDTDCDDLRRCSTTDPTDLHRCSTTDPTDLHRCSPTDPDDFHRCSPTDPDDFRRCSATGPVGPRRCSMTSRDDSRRRPPNNFLFPPSVSSTATSTPLPSRAASPLPLQHRIYPSWPSDTDDELFSPLISYNSSRSSWWPDQRAPWWNSSARRRSRSWRATRTAKRWLRNLVRHPLFPSQPITIVLTLILLSLFAILLTLLLIYILNPDKDPLPWRAYCAYPSIYNTHQPPNPAASYPSPNFPPSHALPFPPPDLDQLPPAGIFLGVFSIDSAIERRQWVRSTWANHARSRNGAGDGDGGVGTSRTIVRFVLAQPRGDWERRIQLEQQLYNDIIILPMWENMNDGKTHTFFSWASINAWVPPVMTNSTTPPPSFTYSNYTSSPPALAPHDPYAAWIDVASANPRNWVRPDYVVKVDDDSFVMLAELEARLRLELHTFHDSRHTSTTSRGVTMMFDANAPTQLTDSDPLIYWGYLVTNKYHQFMAGELYALSWPLVDWVAKDPMVKTMTKGAEDKQTAKWMRIHPRRDEIRWTNERCWIYDHPRSGTVYAHGFLFPSEVTRVKRQIQEAYGDNAQKVLRDMLQTPANGNSPTPTDWAHSSVSTFRVRYAPPLPDLSISQSLEALVEGSDMSLLKEGSAMTPEYAWAHREGRRTRYEGNRVGGTVAVHFIKKQIWFLETAMAMLEGDERSEHEMFEERQVSAAEPSGRPWHPVEQHAIAR